MTKDSHSVSVCQPDSRRIQFGLKLVMILFAIAAIPLAWMSHLSSVAQKESEAVQRLNEKYGITKPFSEMPELAIGYEYEIDSSSGHVMDMSISPTRASPVREPGGPLWLKIMFGSNVFSHVSMISVHEHKEFESLDELKEFSQLEHLRLQYADALKSLDGIESFKDLKTLDIDECKNILDIDAVESLPSLEKLAFNPGNWRVVDLAPVRELNQLVELHINQSKKITNAHVIEGLSSLQHLNLFMCTELDSIPFLGGLKELRRIDIWNQETITDLEFLNGANGLDQIYVVSCPNLKSIAGIETAVSLQAFTAHGCDIDDITPLASLRNLKSVSVAGTQSLEPLRGHSQIQRLSVRSNDLTDIDALSTLTGLKKLQLAAPKTRFDCQLLNELKQIEDLELVGCGQVSYLATLKQLPALRSLRIDSSEISDLNQLVGLTGIQRLRINNKRYDGPAKIKAFFDSLNN